MAFNKNVSKRLSTIAGIERESRDIINLINTIVDSYLQRLLQRLIDIVVFSGRKTIIVEDLRFLPKLCSEYPQIACASNFGKLTKVCIKDLVPVLEMKKGYTIYSRKKPFETLVRNNIHKLHEEDIRIGKNVIPLLQTLTEHYIIQIMNHAATYMSRDGRDTLLARDIETVTKIIKQ